MAVREAPARRTEVAPLLVVGCALAVLCAVGLTVPVARPAFGLPDPGLAVRAGLPAIRVLAEVLAVLGIGALLAAAVLVRDSADRARALAVARRCCGWWAVFAAIMVPLVVADSLNRTLLDALDPALLGNVLARLPSALAWLVVAHVAALVWLGIRLDYRPPGLLVLAVLGTAPVAVTGHSSAGGDHDLASDSLVLHVAAASVWIGGLVALLVIAGAGRAYRATAAHRFSRIALVCWLVVAATGLANALVRLRLPDLLTSRYGVLVLVKLAALVLLGGFGWLHRRHSLTALSGGRAAVLLRLGGCEVLVMLATVGVAVGLGRTPGPRSATGKVSPTEVLIGYPLPNPPTLLHLATEWRFDLLFGTAAVLAALRSLTRERRWPWLAGCALLLVATCSGLARYEPAAVSLRVLTGLLVGLAVPYLLARGGLRLPPVRSAGALVAAVPVLLFVAGGYDVLAGQHWARSALFAVALLSGCLLLANPRPLALLIAAAGHAAAGVALLTATSAQGASFLARLAVPWQRDLLSDQHLAGWLLLAVALTLSRLARVRPRHLVPGRSDEHLSTVTAAVVSSEPGV